MLRIGEYHTLTIDRETEPGLFLKQETENEDGSIEVNEVLLPKKYIPKMESMGSMTSEGSFEMFAKLSYK